MPRRPPFRLYLITDRRVRSDLPGALEGALSALPRGAAAVQLREKELSTRALFELGQELRAITRRHGAKLLVNDRLDVAKAIGADGVHLTGRSLSVADARAWLGPGALVGASCHSLAELEARREADFATLSPIFPSPGKGPAIGLEALAEAARTSSLPLFALGGIGPGEIPLVLAAGAHGVSAIRAWLEDDPALSTGRLWARVQKEL